MAEIAINVQILILVVHKSLLCKSDVMIRHSLPVERDSDLTGVRLCLLGIRLPHHYSPHASHSFGPDSSQLMVLVSDSIFRIAIWNRNVMVSLIAFVVLSSGIALNMRRMFRVPCCSYQYLMSLSALAKDW